MRTSVTLFFSVCSVVHAVDVSAQARDSAPALPDIIVTATRTPMPREAITASVTVLDGAALRARGLTTVAEALRDLPEAAVIRTGSYGAQTSLFLRGGESNFTQVLIDDVPVNDPGGAFDFATLTLDNVERIEVLRGPASVLYGSDAVSGVVHIVTTGGRGGHGGHGGQVAVRYGSYETLDVGASAVGVAGPLSWSVSGSRNASAGIYAFNNTFENLVGTARVGLDLGRTTAGVTARYADGRYDFPTNSAGMAVDSNQYQTTETVTSGVDVAHRFSSTVEARAQLAINRLDGLTDNQPDFVGDGRSTNERTLTRRLADARVNVRVRGVLVSLGSTVEGEHEVTAFESQSSFGPFSSSFDETRRNVAGYAQATGSVGALALSAGGRVDDNQQFGTFVTGRGGLAYQVASGTRLRGNIGTGFKEPTFFENFGGSGVVGNPDLEPEQSRSWEIGAEQALADGRVRLEATWFVQRFEDLIEFIGAPANAGDPNYVNVAGARSDGLEITGVLRLPSPVSRLTVSYSRLITEVTASGGDPTFAVGERLVRRPGHALSARVDMTPVPAVRVSAGARYTGERVDLDYTVVDFVTVFDPARVTLAGYALVDLSAGWVVARGVTIEGAVENLLDTDYQEVLGFATPGRVLSVGGRLSM